MTITLQGKIVEIYTTHQVNEKFRKREFVIEHIENSQFPEYLKLEFNHDKCQILDHYKVGDFVEVNINLKGRAVTNQQGTKTYYNTLQAWKILRVDESTHEPIQAAASSGKQTRSSFDIRDQITNSLDEEDEN